VKKSEVKIFQSNDRHTRYVSEGQITPSPSGSKKEQCCSRTCAGRGVLALLICLVLADTHRLMLMLLRPVILGRAKRGFRCWGIRSLHDARVDQLRIRGWDMRFVLFRYPRFRNRDSLSRACWTLNIWRHLANTRRWWEIGQRAGKPQWKTLTMRLAREIPDISGCIFVSWESDCANAIIFSLPYSLVDQPGRQAFNVDVLTSWIPSPGAPSHSTGLPGLEDPSACTHQDDCRDDLPLSLPRADHCVLYKSQE
jgi:hypothetical protein